MGGWRDLVDRISTIMLTNQRYCLTALQSLGALLEVGLIRWIQSGRSTYRVIRGDETDSPLPFGYYAGQKNGTFPMSVKVSVRAIAWSEKSVDSWIDRTIAASIWGTQPDRSMAA